MSGAVTQFVRALVFRAVPAVIVLVACEVALRLADLPKTDTCWITKEDFWVEDAELGFTYRPGSVVAAVSAPHRAEAFAAARFAIDALKVSVPVWKREVWPDGSAWGTNAAELVDATDVASPPGVAE